LKGERSGEDFDALKQNITEETALIQKQIIVLESERFTMEELIARTRRELVDLPAAWKKAGLSQRRELCEMLFPNGLVWSQSWGFLNSKNTTIKQDLLRLLGGEDFRCQCWRPRRDLNPSDYKMVR